MTKSCDALIPWRLIGGYPETLTVCGVYYPGHRARDVIRCPISEVEGLRQSSLAVLIVTKMVAAMSAHERLHLLVRVRDPG